jgi:hypothetical protein
MNLLRVAEEVRMNGNGCDDAGLRGRLMKPKNAMAAKADETRNEPYYGCRLFGNRQHIFVVVEWAELEWSSEKRRIYVLEGEILSRLCFAERRWILHGNLARLLCGPLGLHVILWF